MSLMCCDSCCNIEFKPVSLGIGLICVCKACKKLSTHTSIANFFHAGVQKIEFDTLHFKDCAKLMFEVYSADQPDHTLQIVKQSRYEAAHLH